MLTDAVLITLQFITTVCSIVVAAWVGWSVVQSHEDQRRHNRLSVQPFLDVFIHFDAKNCSIRVEVINNGIGPAILESVDLLSKQGSSTDRDPLAAAAISISRVMDCECRCEGTTFENEYALRAGESFLASRITYDLGEKRGDAYKQLRFFVLENIYCKVKFRTIYGENGEHVGP